MVQEFYLSCKRYFCPRHTYSFTFRFNLPNCIFASSGLESQITTPYKNSTGLSVVDATKLVCWKPSKPAKTSPTSSFFK